MSPIDLSVFNQLKEISGEDFINDLIDAFLDESPGMLAGIESALASGDVESFRRNAHSLKSNAATFGASDLAALARELEMMGREGNLEIGTRLEALKESYAAAAERLKGLHV
jgi:HPt (histidine-containing phosphotransfer) domain-containing protein